MKLRKSGCIVYGCNSKNKHLKLSLHRFPKDPERCKIWFKAAQRPDLEAKPKANPYRSMRLCSLHFEDKMFTTDEKNRLIKHAIPRLPIQEGCGKFVPPKSDAITSSSKQSDCEKLQILQSKNFNGESPIIMSNVKVMHGGKSENYQCAILYKTKNPELQSQDSSVLHNSKEPTIKEEHSDAAFSEDVRLSPNSDLDLSITKEETIDMSSSTTSVLSHEDDQLDMSEVLPTTDDTSQERGRSTPVFFHNFIEEDLECPDKRHLFWNVSRYTIEGYCDNDINMRRQLHQQNSKIRNLEIEIQYLKAALKLSSSLSF